VLDIHVTEVVAVRRRDGGSVGLDKGGHSSSLLASFKPACLIGSSGYRSARVIEQEVKKGDAGFAAQLSKTQ
jgi:hypothetical protein